MTTSPFTTEIRQFAQSILAGVQRLEEADAVAADDDTGDVKEAVANADREVWSLIDWIEAGRPD